MRLLGRGTRSRQHAPTGARPADGLLERAARGDRAAQQDLLLREVPRMRARIGRLVGADSERDDLVQIACVELLRSLPRYRGEAGFDIWVDRISTRVVYKHFRSSARRRRRVVVAADVDRECDRSTARALEWRAAMQAAREALEDVRPERRIVYLLVAVEGRTLAEAAAMLDLSLPAAKARFLRARRDLDRIVSASPELRDLLEREGGGHE